MKVNNISKQELTHQPTIDSHNEVLKYCDELERLYALHIVVTHNNGMEYSFQIRDLYSDLVLLNYHKNTPGKAKNYLKGLIDAHKIQLK